MCYMSDQMAMERNDKASFPNLLDHGERRRWKEEQARELRAEAQRNASRIKDRGMLCPIHHKPIVRTVGKTAPNAGATFYCEDC